MVKLTIGLVIALIEKPLVVQVAGENFGVLVNTAVLNGRSGMHGKLAVHAQPPRQEENLRMERPGAHVLIKICQVGVFGFGLIKWLPTQFFAQERYQG